MKRKKVYLFLPIAIMALSMSCSSSDSSSSGEERNPVKDCTSADFLPSNPDMYVRALYLRPWNVDTVVADADPSIKDYLETVAYPSDWGGLHMTVTSFARSKGAPTPSRNGCRIHGSVLMTEVDTMAEKANHDLQDKRFMIPTDKWSSSPKVSEGLTIFYITGESHTLHELLGAGNENLIGLKSGVHKLHVSFQGDQSAEMQVRDIREHLLDKLEWQLCEVQITLEHHNEAPHDGLTNAALCRYIGSGRLAP